MEKGDRVYRNFTGRSRTSSDQKRSIFKVTTSAKDRHGTVIVPAGVDIESFKTNPVVLHNHNHDRVVGRAVNVQKRGIDIIAEVEFDEEDDFAANIARQVRGGFLNAASMGFIVDQFEVDEDGNSTATESEMVEFSIVAVPSNSEALVMQRSMKEEIAELKQLVTDMNNSQRAAEGVPGESSEEANTDSDSESPEVPADPDATLVPDDEAASHTAEEEENDGEEDPPEAPDEPVRMATDADYQAIATALVPHIHESVLRAIGRK